MAKSANSETPLRIMSADLRRWNAEINVWEARLEPARGKWRTQLQNHLCALRRQRDVTAASLRKAQRGSSPPARTAEGTPGARATPPLRPGNPRAIG